MAQQISSMVLSLRKKSNIRVRQPLNKIMIPVLNTEMQLQLEKVSDLILSEVNVKSIEYLGEDTAMLVKKIKPNFKSLGPKYGRLMKQIAAAFAKFEQEEIRDFEKNQGANLQIEGQEVVLNLADVEILTEDIPGWMVSTQDQLTVALDITITSELANEGLARELINRVQNLRKDQGLEVTDKIILQIESNTIIHEAVEQFRDYICSETLAQLSWHDALENANVNELDLIENVKVKLSISKAS
jgi:isoleucyl-tRNA synthetase